MHVSVQNTIRTSVSDHSDDSGASEGVHRVFSSDYLISTCTNELDYNDICVLGASLTTFLH